MENPRARAEDLTAKARIRNSALDLFARHGQDRVSMRAVAAEAGVAVGLVQHHFKTKAGLREAVDRLVADYFATALAAVPSDGDPRGISSARDEAVRAMLDDNPSVVNYLRRAILEPEDDQGRFRLLEMFIDLASAEVAKLRSSGVASAKQRESVQVVGTLVRFFGEYMLYPLVDAVWDRLDRETSGPKPRMTISVGD